jgi:two-component system, OmpR family, phosphate regulon sensor histidine kinase PhoR
MKEKKLLWQLYPSYLIVIAVTLLLMCVYAAGAFNEFYFNQTTNDLKSRTVLIETQSVDYLQTHKYKELTSLLVDQGQKINTRFTIIDRTGTVVADSDEDPSVMDNHKNRPEIVKSLGGKWGTSTRYSRTLRTEMLYISKPIKINNQIVGAIRSSVSINELDTALSKLTKKLLGWALLICLFSGVISFFVSRKITAPIEALTKGADEFSKGNFDYRVSAPKTKEFRKLSDSLNNMAGQLKERMKTILKQSHEKESILSNMAEGIITVDNEKKITTINQAAKNYFCENNEELIGRSVGEVIRNSTIQSLINSALDSQSRTEDFLTLSHPQKKTIHAHSVCLIDTKKRSAGALVVLHDITNIKKLESIRKNFVANVSHELKTPVTLIKGFLETLFRGAAENKDERDEFLTIIQEHANRLEAIIEDLLSLSRIEQENDNETIETDNENLNEVIKKAIGSCKEKAEKRGSEIVFNTDGKSIAKINASLIEQAIINLVDNAVKYSPEKSKVVVGLEITSSENIITVSDMGTGIPEKHITHLFERFYRVDKARSREIGGTGLGLAIVKHIAQAHNGSVSVKSKENEGSQFSIHLPTNQRSLKEESNG